MKTTYHEEDGKSIIYREQETAPIIQEIKSIKQVTDGRGDTSLGYFVGHIPNIIIELYMKRAGVTYEEFMATDVHVRKIMNDPDYRDLRVFEGKM